MTVLQFDPDVIDELRARIEAKQAALQDEPAETGLVPLEIKCAMTACKNGRHCLDYFRKPRKQDPVVSPGDCRDCGTNIIELPELGGRNYGNLDELLATCTEQQSELIRAHYWHVQIDQWAYNQARRLGLNEVRQRVRTAVINAMTGNDSWTSRGASYSRKIVPYAQHATATCCRRCAAYWHGLSPDLQVAPTQNQLDHVVSAALAWVEIRLGNLPASPEVGVPNIYSTDLLLPDRIAALDDTVFEALGHGHDPVGLLVPVGTLIEIKPTRGALLVKRQLSLEGAVG